MPTYNELNKNELNKDELNKDEYKQIFKFLDIKILCRLSRVNKEYYAMLGQGKDEDVFNISNHTKQNITPHEHNFLKRLKLKNTLREYIQGLNLDLYPDSINCPITAISSNNPYLHFLEGVTPLCAAVINYSVSSVRLAIRRQANINKMIDDDENNILHHILKYVRLIQQQRDMQLEELHTSKSKLDNLLMIFKILLEEDSKADNFNLKKPNKAGLTPLAYFENMDENCNYTRRFRDECDKYYIKLSFEDLIANPDIDKFYKRNIQELFKKAKTIINRNSKEAVNELIHLKNYYWFNFFMMMEDFGFKLLVHAVKAGAKNILKEYFIKEENDLLEQVINSSIDDDNNTLLHIAAKNKDIESVEILIKLGAEESITKHNKEGLTPLDIAHKDNRPPQWRYKTRHGISVGAMSLKVYNYLNKVLENFIKRQQLEGNQISRFNL